MGMFDYIKIKKELPLDDKLKSYNLNWDEVEFQTKSLENCMNQYTIDEDGFLFLQKIDGVWVQIPENERTNKWDFGYFEEKSRTLEKIDFHGIIKFYCVEDLKDSNEQLWADFDAYFIYGKLDKLILVSSQTYITKSLDDFLKKQEIENKKPINVFKKYIKWREFCRLLSRTFYKISNFFSKMGMLVIKIM